VEKKSDFVWGIFVLFGVGVADRDTRFSLSLFLFEIYPVHGIDRKFLIPILFEEEASHPVLR
jgi:hypothetical protein